MTKELRFFVSDKMVDLEEYFMFPRKFIKTQDGLKRYNESVEMTKHPMSKYDDLEFVAFGNREDIVYQWD